MGVELDKKHATIAMRACYRSASRHPLVVVMILFTIWFSRSFPLLFSLLVYASPVIVSTATLLGALLLFGHKKALKIQKQGKPHHHEIHSQRIRVVEDTEIDVKGVRSEARENAFEKKIPVVNNVNLNDDHRKVEINSRRSSIDSTASMADKILKEEAKREVCSHNQKTDLGREKIVFVNRCAQCHTPLVNNTENHKPWETRSETSSQTASMAGTFPMVDDLPPLLQPEAHHHAHMSNVNSYPASNHSNVNSYPVSNHSLESDDHDHDDDDEEANVNEKEETVSTWTEDDQKNLRNLGKSESERSQQIENLLARQKAIRNMRIQAEENLVNINLDISYSATPCASTRRNSIDQPFDLNETVLDSVPIVTMPRINPYDLPYDSSGDKSYPAGPTYQSDPLSFQPNPQFSHHNESFDVGPATFGASENVSQRSRSSDDDEIVNPQRVPRDRRFYEFKANKGGESRKEKSTVGNEFESDSLSLQPNNHQFSHRHADVGPPNLGGSHAPEVSEYVSHNYIVKLHQVVEGEGRLDDEVKRSDGGEKGYQGKSSGESSSSSSFSDVSDHLDDIEEEYNYSSAIMPSTPDR